MEQKLIPVQQSPLAEVSPMSLGELMTSDPFGWTRENLTQIVAAFREKRLEWEASEKVKQPKAAASLDQPAKKKLSLAELGLDKKKLLENLSF